MHVWAIRVRLQIACRLGHLALFDIALDSKLRACDVVALRLPDIIAAGALRSRAIVVQQKTGRPVQFEITEQAGRSLADWIKLRRGDADGWLFPSRMIEGAHLSTRQYTRLLKRWIQLIGLEPAAYGTHSLRRTKVALLYRKTGNVRACQLLPGHTKLESTVRYLGVELDDALALSEGLEIWSNRRMSLVTCSANVPSEVMRLDDPSDNDGRGWRRLASDDVAALAYIAIRLAIRGVKADLTGRSADSADKAGRRLSEAVAARLAAYPTFGPARPPTAHSARCQTEGKSVGLDQD